MKAKKPSAPVARSGRAIAVYPLARDAAGHPLVPPAGSVGWNVGESTQVNGRRLGRRMLVRDRGGAPLVLPFTATLDDLRAVGCPPGDYRLAPVDEDGRRVAGEYAFATLEREAATARARPDDEHEGRPRTEEGLDRLERALEAQVSAIEQLAHGLDTLSRLLAKLAPGQEDRTGGRPAAIRAGQIARVRTFRPR